ncbi:MAG TPA: hypothetical protein VJI96_03985 [Candidatus Andersenbacteria bacterium]|nr:hypothetical protein [Candidatus Andersenbacteria bacterium]
MKQVYREHFIALLVFSLLAIFMTFPVIFHMKTNIAGSGGDPWQTMWRFESKATSGISGFASDIFGLGEPRLANLSVWPWMPLHLVFGEPIAYNVIWLLHFILAGYAMAVLMQVLTRSTTILSPASILAGIAYMFMPYHVAHSLGHFGAMQLEWIPFIVASAISLFRSPTILKTILFGLLVTTQAWTEHHYIVWLSLFALITGFVYRSELLTSPSLSFVRRGDDAKLPSPYEGEGSGMRWAQLLILLTILLLGIIFPFIPTMKLAATNSGALELGASQTIRFSADLFSFIVPPSYHPIWGSLFDSLFTQFFTGNDAENVQYVGISILLAILFFHKHIPVKQKRLWILTAVFFGSMSLGPVLHIFGKLTTLPLPYALFTNLPVFSAIRVIARAGVMVSFASIVLFGWVIATNFQRVRTSVVIGFILLLEFAFFPFPMQSAMLSPVYDNLQNIPGKAIIELPAATNYTAASRSLYASLRHAKEVLGNIALERGQDTDVYARVKSIPSIRQLLYLRTTDLAENRKEFFDQDLLETLPDAMKYLDARAIIIHTDSLSSLQNAAIEGFFEKNSGFVKRSFEDAILYVLDTARGIQTDGVFLIRGKGWEHVGYDPKKQSVFGEISQEAKVTLVNINSYPVSIVLQYSLAPGSEGSLKATNELVLQPGEREILFTHAGNGKSVIQNPVLRVSPLRP